MLDWKIVAVYVVRQYLVLQAAGLFVKILPALELFEDDQDKRYIVIGVCLLVVFQIGFGIATAHFAGPVAWTLVPLGSAAAGGILVVVLGALVSLFGPFIVGSFPFRGLGWTVLGGTVIYAALAALGLAGVYLAQSIL